MIAGILTPAVLEWAERMAPGARIAGHAVRPLAGGAVSRQVEQVTLHLTGQLGSIRGSASTPPGTRRKPPHEPGR